jgi:hypothetical protein
MCPADYRYQPSAFDRPPDIAADVLYVAGGLYGNLAAFDTIEQLAAQEPVTPVIVFNGDFHWFDAEPDWFAEIDIRVARHHAIRGNVETEIARTGDIGAGCGCAYPESVDDGVVERSNAILRDLRDTAARLPGLCERLAALSMHLVATVGRLRVGIVHGDAASLAGWRFAHDALDGPANAPWLADMRARTKVDAFASSHTCLAALRDFHFSAGRLTVINNGAAGMANFAGTNFGLLTRIATCPSPHTPAYGLARDGVYIDAIPVHYDQRIFLARFLARWPENSAAHESYFQRFSSGPGHTLASARPARSLTAA